MRFGSRRLLCATALLIVCAGLSNSTPTVLAHEVASRVSAAPPTTVGEEDLEALAAAVVAEAIAGAVMGGVAGAITGWPAEALVGGLGGALGGALWGALSHALGDPWEFGGRSAGAWPKTVFD